MYGESFRDGTTRRQVYDNALRKATRDRRIPEDAAAVLVEIRITLRTYIWETRMQKHVRLDAEFDYLQQGGLSHADFRAQFESKLQDMEDSTMDMPTAQTLFRKYLTKLDAKIRIKVMSKEWKIDGPEAGARVPATYQDVARAVGLLLEEQADIHATGTCYDQMMAIDNGQQRGNNVSARTAGAGKRGGGSLQCSHCQQVDNHYSVVCPQRAADVRGDTAECMKRFSSSGTRCTICKQPGHEQRHHIMAISDYKGEPKGKGKGQEGKKSGRGTGKNQNGSDRTTSTPQTPACPEGKKKCRFLGRAVDQLRPMANATIGIRLKNSGN